MNFLIYQISYVQSVDFLLWFFASVRNTDTKRKRLLNTYYSVFYTYPSELRVRWDGTQKIIPWDKLLKSVPWDGIFFLKLSHRGMGRKIFRPIPSHPMGQLKCKIYLIMIDRLRLSITILIHVTFHDFIKMEFAVWSSNFELLFFFAF